MRLVVVLLLVAALAGCMEDRVEAGVTVTVIAEAEGLPKLHRAIVSNVSEEVAAALDGLVGMPEGTNTTILGKEAAKAGAAVAAWTGGKLPEDFVYRGTPMRMDTKFDVDYSL